MTTTLDIWRAGQYITDGIAEEELDNPSAFLSPVPLIGGDPASNGPCGVSDVEGNIAFFNCLETGVRIVSPLGASQLASAFVYTPIDGNLHPVPMITQGNPPFTIPVNAGGYFVLPRTGSYFINFNISLHVTAAAQWFVSVFVINGANATTVANTLSFPSALVNPVNISLNTLGYVFPGQIGTVNAQVGLGISFTQVTAATVDTIDGQIDYIASNPGG